MKQSYLITTVVAVVVGAAAFFGGMQYQQHQGSDPQLSFRATGQLGNSNRQGNQGFQNGQVMSGLGMRPVSGEILSQDESTLTIKQPDGSTKIVLVSDQTTFHKTAEATKNDLTSGVTVTVMGLTNPDGSITAQNIALGFSGLRDQNFPVNSNMQSPTPKAQ